LRRALRNDCTHEKGIMRANRSSKGKKEDAWVKIVEKTLYRLGLFRSLRTKEMKGARPGI